LLAVRRKEQNLRELRGRMEIEMKDIRLETIGYL
jgi:hypothetical protein